MRLLARELRKVPDITQQLVTRRGSDLARRVHDDGVQVRAASWRAGLDPRALWTLCRAIAEFEPNLLHAHDSHALQLAAWARRLSLRGRRSAPPALVATRRVDFHLRRASVWRRVDCIIAISRAVERVLIADGIAPAAIVLVPSGIDPDLVRESARPLDVRGRLGLPASAPLAINVAALVPHKDQMTLLRAASVARGLRPELHWLVAGEGELHRALAAEIARLELGNTVHMLGYVPDADSLIREADVLVMSSREEGLGSVVLHALALGKPVVATRGGGLPEMVPDRWLVPVGDADALARKVVATLGDPSRLPLPPQFTALAMARGVLAAYQSLT